MFKKAILFFVLLLSNASFSQNDNIPEELDEVVINSSRIDIPFSENSRTITIITSNEIQLGGVTNVTDLLQQVAGLDIRRRGTVGMQSDLYIRGGSFDQTLLLIDGIKVEDSQTGHHTMNMALPIEVIERIEIIKGPAARVFGQNAFTGAVNIVTKSNADSVNSLGYQLGSFNQQNVSGTLGKELENRSIIGHASVNASDGYRYNTDFQNQNYFLKGSFNKDQNPMDVLGYFTKRKFGANGFYASPSAIDQYEETQTSLVGVSSKYQAGRFQIKPRIYWRRNQDMYVFVRDNPSIYRNLHITNKVGLEVNTSYESDLGVTGFGVDLAKVYLRSNNLGNRKREMINVFFEHRFKLFDDKLDITPGIAVNYFSDFKFHAFPGIDLGYEISQKIKVYGNIGYTYRIPTYTDLYYSDPTTLGNENLDPEEAIAQELGLKYFDTKINASIAFFNRDSDNLIDYVKENEDDRWQATNIRKLNTIGFEINTSYNFKINEFDQNIKFGYTFIEDEVKELDIEFSRYSINSLRHHLTSTFKSQ
ncbi:MAG: TonB-dependent receptor, partial [Flavobacteriaceae bacterium]|nr:TonB-dependent receptor [Flavobacteriaceae bacterium]